MKNQVFNEDCLVTMGKMPNSHIDLVVTSPPYDNLREYDGYSKFDFDATSRELYRVVKDGGVVVWVVSDQVKDGTESGTSFRQALGFMDAGFNLFDTMIYEKPPHGAVGSSVLGYWQTFEFMFVLSKGLPKHTNILRDRRNLEIGKRRNTKQRTPSGEMVKRVYVGHTQYGRRTNIWRYTIGGRHSSKEKCASEHPALFPEKLAADHIKSWSNEGDIVYDPFSGSGTTLKMARNLGRIYIGSEINPKYYDVIRRRLHLDNTKMDDF